MVGDKADSKVIEFTREPSAMVQFVVELHEVSFRLAALSFCSVSASIVSLFRAFVGNTRLFCRRREWVKWLACAWEEFWYDRCHVSNFYWLDQYIMNSKFLI